MSARTNRKGFATRPADPEQWIKAGPPPKGDEAATNTARLTIDVTPELRGRIKIAAFLSGSVSANGRPVHSC